MTVIRYLTFLDHSYSDAVIWLGTDTLMVTIRLILYTVSKNSYATMYRV